MREWMISHRITIMIIFMFLSEGIAGLSFVLFVIQRDLVALGISLFSLVVSVGLHILISVHALYDRLVMSLPVSDSVRRMTKLTTSEISERGERR